MTISGGSMNLISFGLIFTGVMLNAAAQILMKAGTNAIGHFEFSMENIVPIGWKLATEWHIIVALCCYALSVVIWILALSRVPVSIAFPMLSMAYVVNAHRSLVPAGRSLQPDQAGRHGGDHSGRDHNFAGINNFSISVAMLMIASQRITPVTYYKYAASQFLCVAPCLTVET